jgi:hypothetical protein
VNKQDRDVPAYFLSAPTERFLGVLKRLGALPAGERMQIAAAVRARIGQLFDSSDADELRRVAQAAQDERWRSIYDGSSGPTDVGFASVLLVEQWALAKREVLDSASPIAATLAQRRRAAVEAFVQAHPDHGTEHE